MPVLHWGQSFRFRLQKMPTRILSASAMPRRRIWQDCSSPTLDGFTPDETAQNEITDCFRYGWTAKKTGDAITFLVEGSCIARPVPEVGKASRRRVALAVVDDDTEHAVRLDANFDETWGDKLELATLFRARKRGAGHIVTIRLAETHEDDAVPFYLVSVIATGRRGRD